MEGEQTMKAENTEKEGNLSVHEKPQRRSSRSSSGHRRRSPSTERKSGSNSYPEPSSSSSDKKTNQPRRRLRELPSTADNKDDEGKGRVIQIVGWQRNVPIPKETRDDNRSSFEKKTSPSSRSRKPAHLRIYQSKSKAGRSPGRRTRSMEDLSLFADSVAAVEGGRGDGPFLENSTPSEPQSPKPTEDAPALV
jgi:hypothetical protein